MIPEEARKAAHDAAVARWLTGSSDTTQMLLSVDAALDAALPHLRSPENATYTAAEVKVLTERARRDVFDDLLDDWEYGDCPGSKLKIGNQEVWLYTRENVRLWLRDKQRATPEASV